MGNLRDSWICALRSVQGVFPLPTATLHLTLWLVKLTPGLDYKSSNALWFPVGFSQWGISVGEGRGQGEYFSDFFCGRHLVFDVSLHKRSLFLPKWPSLHDCVSPLSSQTSGPRSGDNSCVASPVSCNITCHSPVHIFVISSFVNEPPFIYANLNVQSAYLGNQTNTVTSTRSSLWCLILCQLG